ncbi:MAG TPA: OmpH family outer membrane protein, partial [Pyrinomonadaceae bacterium]|nr:OmpH family outer membrane protein [Pyrinomonadaceae bacterium]
MKLIRNIAAAAAIAALTALSASAQPAASRPAAPAAQRPAATTPAPQTGGAPGGNPVDGKIAIIDTEAFADPKSGITRLVNAFTKVNNEFKPRSDELQRLRASYEQIGKDIEATKNLADQKALAAKADQAETLKNDIERKSQDAQRAYQKRLREETQPIYQEIGTALQAFARQRGITVIFDVSKMGEVMFVVNDGVDLTNAFIADYNQRNPATASTA